MFLRITDDTSDDPIVLKRNVHIDQIKNINKKLNQDLNRQNSQPSREKSNAHSSYFSTRITCPDVCLSQDMRDKCEDFHTLWHCVASNYVKIQWFQWYNWGNGEYGPYTPTPKEGETPSLQPRYTGELQRQFDYLEIAGVFAKPEQVNVTTKWKVEVFHKEPNR